MRLASHGLICVDGKVNQPMIGKGIDLYQSKLVNYFAMLQLRSELDGETLSTFEKILGDEQNTAPGLSL